MWCHSDHRVLDMSGWLLDVRRRSLQVAEPSQSSEDTSISIHLSGGLLDQYQISSSQANTEAVL